MQGKGFAIGKVELQIQALAEALVIRLNEAGSDQVDVYHTTMHQLVTLVAGIMEVTEHSGLRSGWTPEDFMQEIIERKDELQTQRAKGELT